MKTIYFDNKEALILKRIKDELLIYVDGEFQIISNKDERIEYPNSPLKIYINKNEEELLKQLQLELQDWILYVDENEEDELEIIKKMKE